LYNRKNEEKTLPRLLQSLKGVDEILLCDTGSTDKTIEIAKLFGVDVYEKKFEIKIQKSKQKRLTNWPEKMESQILLKKEI